MASFLFMYFCSYRTMPSSPIFIFLFFFSRNSIILLSNVQRYQPVARQLVYPNSSTYVCLTRQQDICARTCVCVCVVSHKFVNAIGMFVCTRARRWKRGVLADCVILVQQKHCFSVAVSTIFFPQFCFFRCRAAQPPCIV